MENNNRKRPDKYYIAEPLNLSDLNTKFIEAFSIRQFSIWLYFRSPKSNNLTRECSESLSIFSSSFFKPFMRSARDIV